MTITIDVVIIDPKLVNRIITANIYSAIKTAELTYVNQFITY